jgi:hypothetical protein
MNLPGTVKIQTTAEVVGPDGRILQDGLLGEEDSYHQLFWEPRCNAYQAVVGELAILGRQHGSF